MSAELGRMFNPFGRTRSGMTCVFGDEFLGMRQFAIGRDDHLPDKKGYSSALFAALG
jgi:hypothetical protein